MTVPESISALVYTMRHPWAWTLLVWVMAGTAYWLMAGVVGEHIPLAFCVLASLSFVGAMPLIHHERNAEHYAFAIIGGVLSQLWCILVAGFLPMFLWWLLWSMVMSVLTVFGWGRYWCLAVELWAMAALVVVLLLHV